MMHHMVYSIYNLVPEDYVHRVGRTARGAYAKGKALLILLENEKNLLNYLERFNVLLLY